MGHTVVLVTDWRQAEGLAAWSPGEVIGHWLWHRTKELRIDQKGSLGLYMKLGLKKHWKFLEGNHVLRSA